MTPCNVKGCVAEGSEVCCHVHTAQRTYEFIRRELLARMLHVVGVVDAIDTVARELGLQTPEPLMPEAKKDLFS